MSWHTKSIQDIKDARIEHRNYYQVQRECVARITSCEPGDALLVIGGLRVGKTHLGADVMRTSYGEIDPNADLQPYVMVTAANASHAGQFSTGDFTRAALRQVRHPLYSDRVLLADSLPIRNSMDRRTEGDMREELVRAMIQRKTKTLILDEMQNTRFILGGSEKAAWFIQSLKCAAFDAGVVLVIIASYEFLLIFDQCEQVIARSDIIHFPAYQSSSDKDLYAWEEILEAYTSKIRFRKSDSLRKWNELLFEESLGCVGLLSKWLRSALATSMVAGSSSLRLEHLLASRRTPRRTAILMDALNFGERNLLGTDLEDIGAPEYVDDVKAKTKPFARKPKRVRPTDRLRAKA